MTQDRAIIGLAHWLKTPAGRYLLGWEQRELDQTVVDVFGFHALQLGLPELDALRANRMPHRWIALDATTTPPKSDAQLSAALQDLVLRVAQAYFDVLLAQDNLELVGAQKTAIAEQLAQAKRNFEVGTATITDTHEAQARFDLATAQEIAARNDLEVKRRALEQNVGGSIPPIASLGPARRQGHPAWNDHAWQ